MLFSPLIVIVWGIALAAVAAAHVAGRLAPAPDTAPKATVLSQLCQVAALLAIFAWRQSLPQWAGAGTCPVARGHGGTAFLLGLVCVATASAAAFAGGRHATSGARTGSFFASLALLLMTAAFLTITVTCDPS